ncbi:MULTISPECIES: phosphodiester glycosidase family protein [unclassified Paenibacillus]|uniref:phosphodiester glycosidase family protein n=1 Tax=unclassified Paenibacillus TaxID=185978 RepID=UPI00040FD0D8|nr:MULTISPECIES: phosphodiester glycosidase family protein [unclassified Paenibacillus]KGP80773.1 exopolysaccharide biosynthesis protein [Paenibacillus sp. MAEPY1]KGP84231.1 exopolysaccharide biosynthesis protein [Paenibacillus sp. MAEPY2]
MITPVKTVNRLFMLALAPFVGLILCMLLFRPPIEPGDFIDSGLTEETVTPRTQAISQELAGAKEAAVQTSSSIKRTTQLYNQTTSTMSTIVQKAAVQAARPETIYNQRISSKLGVPYERIDSDRLTIELYRVNPGPYKGYAMKIKLKDPTAMKMALDSEPGRSETTMQAVKRHGAIAGINAGGFADSGGKRYPLSTTVMDGKYVNGFQASFKDLFFVGLNDTGKLVGGKFFDKSSLDRLQPQFGATFVPVLLQNGQKTAIPAKWKVSPKRAPRTVIGNYKDDQLLIIVVDGYNEGGSSGATLEELQGRMYKLGIVDAYNLDGGGSSSLIVNNRVVNNPSDGSLRPVPTHFLFYK